MAPGPGAAATWGKCAYAHSSESAGLAPLLVLALVAVAALTGTAVYRATGRTDGRPPPPPSAAAPAGCGDPTSAAGLRTLAAACGFDVGAAINDVIFTDQTYRETVAREYSTVTPESALKWGTVEPSPGRFDFAPGDALIQVAEENHQRVRGHTLVWHVLPDWVADGDHRPAEMREILRRHVLTTVAHWRGRIDSWDVVNEVLGTDRALRDSVWLRTIGPDYVADAFRWAREADPGARLLLNDFAVEGINPKSDRLYQFVKDLRARGVPIDGIGFQTHVAGLRLPDTFEANLRRFADLGVQIAITEFDVRLPLPATAAALDAQGRVYARALRACLQLTACRSFTTWGLTDQYSWVDHDFPGQGAALPFDRSYQRKPAYWSLYDTLADGAPAR